MQIQGVLWEGGCQGAAMSGALDPAGAELQAHVPAPGLPPAWLLPGAGLAWRHARQAAREPKPSRALRARAEPTATPRRGSSTWASSKPA